MKFLSMEDILDAKDVETRDVEVPEWGGVVRIRVLSGAERDEFEQSTVFVDKKGNSKPNLANLRARLVAKCAINEDGTKLFQSETAVRALGTKSAAALERLFKACQELNAMTNEDIDELAKDFDDDPSGSSTSD